MAIISAGCILINVQQVAEAGGVQARACARAGHAPHRAARRRAARYLVSGVRATSANPPATSAARTRALLLTYYRYARDAHGGDSRISKPRRQPKAHATTVARAETPGACSGRRDALQEEDVPPPALSHSTCIRGSKKCKGKEPS